MTLRSKLFWDKVASFKFNYWWLVIISMIVHRLPFWLYSPSEAIALKKTAMIASYLILLFAIFKNLKTWGIWLILIGVLLNFAAVGFNEGLMPVTPEARLNAGFSIEQTKIGEVLPQGSGILLTAGQTKLWLLTDVLPVKIGKVGAVCSIGDLIILFGMFVLAIHIIYVSHLRTSLKKQSSTITPVITLRE